MLSEEAQLIGVWGQRHSYHLKQNHRELYMNLLASGRLNNYLADIDVDGTGRKYVFPAGKRTCQKRKCNGTT